MSNAIAPRAADGAPPAAFNPLQQLSALAAQPAVKRSLPMLLIVGLVLAGWLAWSAVSSPPQRILFANVTDADKAAIASALQGANIASSIDSSGSITVAEDDYHKARMLLASQNLPKAAPGGYAILDQLPMGVSRAVEGERLRQARETELARSIEEIDSVAEARVHLATPEASVFVRDRTDPSASVILKLQPGRALGEAQVRSIVNLVASSVPGMRPESVTIVDQMGVLLSRSTDGSGNGSPADQRIDFQRRIETKYRDQLVQLLTPLVGPGNFTAEVQADVDLDESQATRESYDKQGGVIQREQGAWTGTAKDGAAPGGIPGALSNTPPPASQLVNPNAPGQAGAGAPPAGTAPAAPPAPQQKQSDSFARTYATGKEISVTRAMPGGVKRLSVAVLLREEAGKPRGLAEINQITELVRAAVGYDAARQDQVMVVSRKFTAPPADAAATAAWYQADWVPLVARNATALVIALLVLFLGIRPLAKALLKKRDESAPRGGTPLAIGAPDAPSAAPAAPVSIDMLQQPGSGYDERVGLVRGFTRDNPARAALAVRDMIRADAQ
jgi:flagellar M-ring protein FliF